MMIYIFLLFAILACYPVLSETPGLSVVRNLDVESILSAAESPANNCKFPPNFPAGIKITRKTFKNWAGDIEVPDLWTAVPKSVDQIVTMTNWAAHHSYRLRASGYMHNWSPLTVTNSDSCSKSKVILVHTAKYLTKMKMVSKNHKFSTGAVKVQAGASMEDLLTYLEKKGYGFLATPAPGDISIGGAIAIGGHGTGVPAAGETLQPGFTYGSMSNSVISFTAIVWDNYQQKYITRKFHRSDPDAKAFLVNLGRTFLIDVTLRVGRNVNLRCQSRMDIPASELFAKKHRKGQRTISSFIEASGRVEAIWFAFTENPWLKVFTVCPTKPPSSRKVDKPYNFPFSDNIPPPVAVLAGRMAEGAWILTPSLGTAEEASIATGLDLYGDIWGPSKNILLYIRPTTLRVTASGHVVICSRSRVQRVFHSAMKFYKKLVKEYESKGEYPINGPVEIRVTGLDIPEDVGIPGAESPSLSPIRPVEGRPDLDTAVWFDFLTFPRTPLVNEFFTKWESYFLFKINDGVNAVVRPEWSKGWAYTRKACYSNRTVIGRLIPGLFNSHRRNGEFQLAVNILNKYDPAKVFSNDFLNRLLR